MLRAYWGKHLRDSPERTLDKQALEYLLSSPGIDKEDLLSFYGFVNLAPRIRWDTAPALHLASFSGLPSIVSDLLSLGHNPNATDTRGATPLMYASAHGHCGVVSLLLDAGSYINAHNTITVEIRLNRPTVFTTAISLNPVMLAIRKGHHTVLALLLDRDDVLLQHDQNAFVWAVYWGEIEMVKLMLRHPRVDLDFPNYEGQTELLKAASMGWLDIVNILLAANADSEKMNDGGGTPLLRDFNEKNLAIVKALINHGAKLIVRNGRSRVSDMGYAHGYLYCSSVAWSLFKVECHTAAKSSSSTIARYAVTDIYDCLHQPVGHISLSLAAYQAGYS